MKDIETASETGEAKQKSKFKSEEELLSAYNALEREFTKRCQLIKELQASLASHAAAQAEKSQSDAAPEKTDGSATDGPHGDKPNAAAEKIVTADKSAEADGQVALAVKSGDAADAESDIKTFTERRRRALVDLDDATVYAIAHAEELSAVPEVMDACIARYKRKIIAAGSVRAPEGMAVIVPAKRPKTLADAKLLADSMLDKL